MSECCFEICGVICPTLSGIVAQGDHSSLPFLAEDCSVWAKSPRRWKWRRKKSELFYYMAISFLPRLLIPTDLTWLQNPDLARQLFTDWILTYMKQMGLRRKVWTWTKMLNPNKCYFVALLGFVTICALCGRFWAKKCKYFFGKKAVFLWQKVHC